MKLILILLGSRLGFTLAESRDMIGLYDPGSGNVRPQEHMLEKLGDAELRCRDALAATKPDKPRKNRRHSGS